MLCSTLMSGSLLEVLLQPHAFFHTQQPSMAFRASAFQPKLHEFSAWVRSCLQPRGHSASSARGTALLLCMGQAEHQEITAFPTQSQFNTGTFKYECTGERTGLFLNTICSNTSPTSEFPTRLCSSSPFSEMIRMFLDGLKGSSL